MKTLVNLIIYALLLITFCLSPLRLVYAHVLQSSGSIGAVLHIDPNDDPVAKVQSGFFFEFKDKHNKFTPQNCKCIFSIVENGKEIFSQDLFQNNTNSSLTSASIFYTFPEKNVYQIKVTGESNTSGQFQSFTLNYDIRVDKEAQANQSTNSSIPNWFATHIIHLVGGFIVFGFLIFALIKQRSNK